MILMQTTKLNWGRSPHFCYLCYHNAVCRCSAKLLFPCMKYKWKKDRSIITHLQISLHLPLTKLWASGLSFQLLLIRFSRLLNFLYFFFFAACLDLPPDFWLVFSPVFNPKSPDIRTYRVCVTLLFDLTTAFLFLSFVTISSSFFFFLFVENWSGATPCRTIRLTMKGEIHLEWSSRSVDLRVTMFKILIILGTFFLLWVFLTVCVVSFNSRALVIKLAEESQPVHYYNLV